VIDYQLIYYELFNKNKHLAYIMPIYAYIFIFLGWKSDSGIIFARVGMRHVGVLRIRVHRNTQIRYFEC